MRRSLVGMLVGLVAGCGGGGGSGSSCPPFAQIVAGDFGQTGARLWWTLEVAEIPAMLTFNQAAVGADFMEYRWAVDLDSDRNGEPDLQVAVMHFKQSGAEIIARDILSVTQEDLWAVTGAGTSTIGSIDVTLTANTFRFEVDVAEDPGLALVTERGQSTWTTYHRFGAGLGDQCQDRLN
jgi:hypothetical protein